MFKGEFREYMYYINIVGWDGKGGGGGGGMVKARIVHLIYTVPV